MTPTCPLGDFYQRVSTWNGGVHALVSGDSPRKQSHLLAWLENRPGQWHLRHSGLPCLGLRGRGGGQFQLAKNGT